MNKLGGVIIWIFMIALTFTHIRIYEILKVHCTKQASDIAESRTREDHLLAEIKLLDYQVSVLTEQFLDEKGKGLNGT